MYYNFKTVSYTMDTMYYAWMKDPVQLMDKIELPQFELGEAILFECSAKYVGGKHIDL